MNNISLAGTVETEPKLSHEVSGEKFYLFYFSTKRRSGTVDTVRCYISENLVNEIKEGEKKEIYGEVRTRNDHTGEKTKVIVYVFVKSVDEYSGDDFNVVEMVGCLCRPPVFRTTPLGHKIVDLTIASNREKSWLSDYVPCICWERTAERMKDAEIAEVFYIIGRLQSREYIKNLGEISEVRTAYEVSVSCIGKVEEEE